jgi:hypothetical protein
MEQRASKFAAPYQRAATKITRKGNGSEWIHTSGSVFRSTTGGLFVVSMTFRCRMVVKEGLHMWLSLDRRHPEAPKAMTPCRQFENTWG